MEISESGLLFCFSDTSTAVKYDETDYYRNHFNSFAGSKGVDILMLDNATLSLIEIKNCAGHEADNRWRIGKDNTKRHIAPPGLDCQDRDSFDIEVADKVVMTLAALAGIQTHQVEKPLVSECLPFAQALYRNSTGTARPVIVELILDGQFGCHTRPETAIRRSIQDSIRKKLKWLNCNVSVLSSSDLMIEVHSHSASLNPSA